MVLLDIVVVNKLLVSGVLGNSVVPQQTSCPTTKVFHGNDGKTRSEAYKHPPPSKLDYLTHPLNSMQPVCFLQLLDSID